MADPDYDEHRHGARAEDRILETLRSLGDAQREGQRQLSAQLAQVQADVREATRSVGEAATVQARFEERLKASEAKAADLEARVRPLEQQGARVAAIAGLVALLVGALVETVAPLMHH